MKRFALAVVGLVLATSGSGCCCLSHLCGYGYGNNCSPCATPYAAPAPACGSCGYGPTAPYGIGPTGLAAPVGTTAYVPYATPVYAAAINPAPAL